MQDDDDSQYQDKSEHLSPKEVRRYAEFQAKNGRKMYNNGMIIPTPESMTTIDWLCDEAGILESHHRDIGIQFKALCDSAEGKLIVAPVIEESDIAPIDQHLKIAAVYHQLTLNDKKLVGMIIFEEMKLSDRRGLHHIAPRLQSAFESLWVAMKRDNILDAIAEIQKKALANRKNVAKVVRGCTATSAPRIPEGTYF